MYKPFFGMKKSGLFVSTLGTSSALTSSNCTETGRSSVSISISGRSFLLTLIFLLGSVSMMPAKQKYLDIYMTASNIYLTSNENSYNYRPSQKQAAYYPTKYFSNTGTLFCLLVIPKLGFIVRTWHKVF